MSSYDLSRPHAAFVAAVLVGCIACALSNALLPTDAVLPLLATSFLVFGAGLALLSWGRPGDRSQVNYLDVAGALTLIGFFTAAAIEPEQLLRLVGSRGPN